MFWFFINYSSIITKNKNIDKKLIFKDQHNDEDIIEKLIDMHKNKEDKVNEKSIKDLIEILDGENDFNLKR